MICGCEIAVHSKQEEDDATAQGVSQFLVTHFWGMGGGWGLAMQSTTGTEPPIFANSSKCRISLFGFGRLFGGLVFTVLVLHTSRQRGMLDATTL